MEAKSAKKFTRIVFGKSMNTVLHEIMHGIIYQYGLVETLGEKEEVTVNTITNGLTTVFKDNPWLVDYIKKHI